MLCKTAVIKNIVRDLPKLHLKISNIKALLIDCKKEFGIDTKGALLIADFRQTPVPLCTVLSFYNPNIQFKKYGWVNDKFVSNVKLYQKYKYLDGKSPLEWRQGIKHDASKVLILKVKNGNLLNGLREVVNVEDDLLYPFVKGSELKKGIIKESNSKIIITQKSPSEDTDYIKLKYPRLWGYLLSHSDFFVKRKSRVYKRHSMFSIFGVGNYSFLPYKVAISGMYKQPNFALVFPI